MSFTKLFRYTRLNAPFLRSRLQCTLSVQALQSSYFLLRLRSDNSPKALVFHLIASGYGQHQADHRIVRCGEIQTKALVPKENLETSLDNSVEDVRARAGIHQPGVLRS